MRLFTRTGATAVGDPTYGTFHADEDGGFDLPDELAQKLHRFHIDGRPAWETDLERQNRLITEELERRKDPATLLDAVQQIVAAAQGLPVGALAALAAAQSAPASADTPPPAPEQHDQAPAKRTTKRTAAHPK